MNKLIKLSHAHYIIVDDTTPLPVRDFVYSYVTNTIVIFTDPRHFSDGTYKRISHSTKPLEEICCTPEGKIKRYVDCKGCDRKQLGFDKIKQLSLSEVEEAINGYSVEKIIRQYTGEEMNRDDKKLYAILHSVLKQYKELVKDKLFTVTDMEKAINKAYSKGLARPNSGRLSDIPKVQSEIIQSLLPKTEWECCISDGKLVLL